LSDVCRLALVAGWLLLSTATGYPLIKNKGNFLLVACALVAALDPESIGLQAKRVSKPHRSRKQKYVKMISSMSWDLTTFEELTGWSQLPSGNCVGS
jgi:hypothetical protein